MGLDFTQKRCIKALLKIGFTDASKRRSKHFKYRPPEKYINNYRENIRPFITVPKHKFFCQEAIVNEVGKICGEEMKQEFLKNL
ncbi:MAG: hypothetical protein AAB666_02080 [Patescibacteria group bacterium]